MKFGKWAAINNGGGVAGVLITVILSFFIRDVWALALGNVAESAFRCLFSYILCPYLPSLSWDRTAVRELLKFSRGLLGLAFLNLIFMRTDVFVLAKLYPSSDLGLYIIAVSLVQTPVGFIMNLLGQTLLPTYAQIQGSDERINRILLRVTAILAYLGTPLLVLAFFCGRSLLTFAYGRPYGAATAPLVVASFVALANLLNAQITTTFYAKGSPQLHRTCVVIMAVIMIATIYPFVKWLGPVGGQVACLISILAGYSFQIARGRNITGLDIYRYGKILLAPAGISLAVAAVCLGARSFPTATHPVPNIVLGIGGAALAYLLSVILVRSKRDVIA